MSRSPHHSLSPAQESVRKTSNAMLLPLFFRNMIGSEAVITMGLIDSMLRGVDAASVSFALNHDGDPDVVLGTMKEATVEYWGHLFEDYEAGDMRKDPCLVFLAEKNIRAIRKIAGVVLT